MKQTKAVPPSIDQWMREAKSAPGAENAGMYLVHNGVVRATAKARVREGDASAPPVTGMEFSYDRAELDAALAAARTLPGICYVRAWLNEGRLRPGDDLMMVLIGGDIRPHVVDALQTLVGRIKAQCVTETELYD